MIVNVESLVNAVVNTIVNVVANVKIVMLQCAPVAVTVTVCVEVQNEPYSIDKFGYYLFAIE